MGTDNTKTDKIQCASWWRMLFHLQCSLPHKISNLSLIITLNPTANVQHMLRILGPVKLWHEHATDGMLLRETPQGEGFGSFYNKLWKGIKDTYRINGITSLENWFSVKQLLKSKIHLFSKPSLTYDINLIANKVGI